MINRKTEIEKLKLQVCNRLRVFILEEFKALNKESMNFHFHQNTILLKFTKLVEFVRNNHAETYLELTNMYAEQRCRKYYAVLKAYMYETSKLVEEKISKADTVIIDEAKHLLSPEEDPYNLSEREVIFDEDKLSWIEADPIIPYHSSLEKETKTLEEVFRSQNLMLTNIITTEFAFVIEFFGLKSSQCGYIFNKMFTSIVNAYIENLETTCQGSWDPISIILMVLINDEFKSIMRKRKIHILDIYFDKVGMTLWPRFTTIFEHFLDITKNANPKNF